MEGKCRICPARPKCGLDVLPGSLICISNRTGLTKADMPKTNLDNLVSCEDGAQAVELLGEAIMNSINFRSDLKGYALCREKLVEWFDKIAEV